MRSNPLFGERSLTLVAASFSDLGSATGAAEMLRHEGHLAGEVAVIAPHDPDPARKLEPEQRGIWMTLVRSHLILGCAGLLIGVGVGAAAIVLPWPAAASSPGFTLLFAAVMGAFLGMIGAGLITLRPDHGLVIRRVRENLRRGRWAVVARPLDAALARRAIAMLDAVGGKPLRSL